MFVIQKVWQSYARKTDAIRSNPTYQLAKSIWEPVPHKLSLEHQFFLLSCLSNFHKWKYDKRVNITRFCQRFPNSGRFYPGSPINQIIQLFFLQRRTWVIRACVKNIRGENTTAPYVNPKSKKIPDSVAVIADSAAKTYLRF